MKLPIEFLASCYIELISLLCCIYITFCLSISDTRNLKYGTPFRFYNRVLFFFFFLCILIDTCVGYHNVM